MKVLSEGVRVRFKVVTLFSEYEDIGTVVAVLPEMCMVCVSKGPSLLFIPEHRIIEVYDETNTGAEKSV